MKYLLSANNSQGASVEYLGNSIKEVLEKFDSEYNRSGFKIVISKRFTSVIKVIKSTYR